MFRDARAKARARGDANMVRCMDVELSKLGYSEPMETTQAPEMETVVPEKPRRGRKPYPRCEHGMIAERCPDCLGMPV
jgi:hypothetical protein